MRTYEILHLIIYYFLLIIYYFLLIIYYFLGCLEIWLFRFRRSFGTAQRFSLHSFFLQKETNACHCLYFFRNNFRHAVSYRVFFSRIDAYRNFLVNFYFCFAHHSSRTFIFYKNKRKVFLNKQKQDPLTGILFSFLISF